MTAVRGVSLNVRPGEIVGLLGANGAGKTTVIRMLLGLLPPTSGTVAIFGAPPSRDSRRRLGYVPQSLGLYDDLTTAENLSFAATVFGVSGAGLSGAGLSGAGLSDDLRPYASVLAGRLPLGVQRRAAFAQALAHSPGLLILDEPTSGVDPLARARLWDTVRSAAEAGAGVLVTTHDLEEATECDRLIIMADGAVVATGTPAEITGDATATVVRPGQWEPAFQRLEDSDLDVALSGRELRLPVASPDEVTAVLGPGTDVSTAPATLEERFFQLIRSAPADTSDPADSPASEAR
jgi:ABC-2 type transport system ATP-binding protein/ribosome-dependent ATPase